MEAGVRVLVVMVNQGLESRTAGRTCPRSASCGSLGQKSACRSILVLTDPDVEEKFAYLKTIHNRCDLT